MVPCKNYLIERVPNMRGFRIYVYPNATVVVRSSMKSSLKEIDKFVTKNLSWIAAAKMKSMKIRDQNIPVSFQEGEMLKLLGEPYRIVEGALKKIEIKPGRILLLPESFTFAERKKEIQKLYKRTAETVIGKRVEYLAEETGLTPKDVKFRNNKTLWGTCMPEGHIILNWKLICAPISVIDYVIIHELCHLKVRNHSSRFWSLVESFCPNHKQLRLWLRKNHYAFDFLNEISEIHSSKFEPNARRNQVHNIF